MPHPGVRAARRRPESVRRSPLRQSGRPVGCRRRAGLRPTPTVPLCRFLPFVSADCGDTVPTIPRVASRQASDPKSGGAVPTIFEAGAADRSTGRGVVIQPLRAVGRNRRSAQTRFLRVRERSRHLVGARAQAPDRQPLLRALGALPQQEEARDDGRRSRRALDHSTDHP